MKALLPAIVVFVTLFASGCATTINQDAVSHDPWESFNRKVYSFNESVDTVVLKPVATGYVRVVPEPARQGLTNVFGNIRDVWSAANKLLQGKVSDGLQMGARFAVNSTVGLAGLFDPATGMGLQRRPEDFGQTLGHWGLGAGPYVVLPLLGPSTVRDGAAGLLVDRLASPSALISDSGMATAVTVLDVVNTRARFLDATDLLDDLALDRYAFVREAYLARRRDAIQDGVDPADDAGTDSIKAPAETATTRE